MNPDFHQHGSTERSFYHFSFLKDIKVHGVYLNTITRYLNQYPFIRKPHLHDFYTILLFTGGEGSIKICNDLHTVEPQTLFLIAPHQIHSLEGLENAEGRVFFFCQDFYVEEFSFIRLLNVFSNLTSGENNLSPANKLSGTRINPLIDLFESLQHEYEKCGPSNNSAVIIRSLLNIMLLKLSDLYGSDSGEEIKSEGTFIHSLSHLIESYFIREHNIGFYTSAFNITEKHLNDICNRHFNCGLKKILQDRLMQESRRLLLFSELSVSQIAYKLNFEDNSYFNKVFRKNTGLTPKRFREMHKKLLP
jgi:AraC family transcriptional regulator, transcriptional activator of pobA